MTLDEAINHAFNQAQRLGNCACGMEHKQLAEWLLELKNKRKKELNKEQEISQTHEHFSELRIAGRVDGVVRCKEFLRFCVAVLTDIHPLDGKNRSSYFCIYVEGNALQNFLGRVCEGDYISLRAKIKAYLGWGEPFGNPIISQWSSPVHLYIDDPSQIIDHKICSENDKDRIFNGGKENDN